LGVAGHLDETCETVAVNVNLVLAEQSLISKYDRSFALLKKPPDTCTSEEGKNMTM